ncbi:basic proline-rich protein [Camelus dromedarius]|uniref:basic proline-rich protein n=1 Tax=Camelus dromedarius TaxID=9838 RepID=UPI00311A3ED1
MGPKTPIRSLGEASSFTVQMRSFQGHVCTGPAGVRVRECVRVRVSVYGGEAGCCCRGRPRAPPNPVPLWAPAPRLPPLRFPAPAARARDLRPPPPRPHTAAPPPPPPPPPPPRLPRPTAGAGRSQARCPPRAPPGSPRIGVPPKWHSPHPRRPSLIRWHPAPPATGGRRRIAAKRSPARPPDHPSARPRGPPGSPAPPGRGGPGAGGRGGGPGRARLPFSAAAAEPARGPAPAPLPRSLRAAAGADYSGSGSAPSSAPAAGPRRGPGTRAGPGRRGRPGRGPCGSAEPGTAAEAARPAVAARSPGPASARRRVAGVRERAPSRVLPAAVPPARLPSSPPASGPASRAASSGAHYRVAGGVGPARLRALVPRRRVPARPLLSPPPPPPPPPPARPPSLPPGPPACLARSLPPSARCRAPSLRLLRRVPPSHPFSPPSSFPPSGRPRAQASARCSPPAAALAPAPALRSRPGRQRRLGGPGAPRRERPGRAAGPSALGPTSRPLLPRWGSPHAAGRRTRTRGAPTPRWARAPRLGRAPGHSAGGLRQPSPPRGAPLPGTASALGPRIQHWPQGQRPLLSPGRCQVPPPWQPAEPPAAFALQFSGPPPEPTALCLPQHWGWGQQRRPIRAATPTPPATPARCRRRVDASPLSRAKVGAPGPS